MIAAKDLPAPDDRYPVRRALLSVSDKSGLAVLGRRLHALGVELLSTGGTAKALRQSGVPVTDVADVTGFPEILGGRVKSLHPAIHGGILARRTDPDDLAELAEHGIGAIDLVVVNLYPFREATAGGQRTPSRLRTSTSAGRGCSGRRPRTSPSSPPSWTRRTTTRSRTSSRRTTAPCQWPRAAGWRARPSRTRPTTTPPSRRSSRAPLPLATPTASRTRPRLKRPLSPRDKVEGSSRGELPSSLLIDLPKVTDLRYGENPAQRAALYGDPSQRYQTLHGKALSFNNLLDLTAALNLIQEFADAPPTVAILKHTNPCGVGQADDLEAAYHKAFATDRQSPFGGIVVVNRPLDLATARAIDGVFTEIIIAPDYQDGVLDFLQEKQNRRLVRATLAAPAAELDVRSTAGGLLVQDPDGPLRPDVGGSWTVPTERQPTERERADLEFAWRVCKHVKSNAIVYARDGATLGVGAGQMSRIDASEVAVAKGAKSELDFAGCVVASDAFFPFADGLVAAAEAGATAAIQPGGSVRDDEVVAAADERGLAMVFTGRRHFRH